MINQCVRYTLGIGEFSGHYEELFVLISTTGDYLFLFCLFFFFADVENFLLLLWSNFQLRVESFSGPFWFCVTQLCDWSKSSRLFLNQSDLETEAGRELATSVFLRFQQFTFLIVSSHLAMRT